MFDIEKVALEWQGVRMFDIAANLSDERFHGNYYGKQVHRDDFDKVIQRA